MDSIWSLAIRDDMKSIMRRRSDQNFQEHIPTKNKKKKLVELMRSN